MPWHALSCGWIILLQGGATFFLSISWTVFMKSDNFKERLVTGAAATILGLPLLAVGIAAMFYDSQSCVTVCRTLVALEGISIFGAALWLAKTSSQNTVSERIWTIGIVVVGIVFITVAIFPKVRFLTTM